MAKPRPEWQSAQDMPLSERAKADLLQMKSRQSSDLKLMDGVELAKTFDSLALGSRLGQCPLGKAMRSLQSLNHGEVSRLNLCCLPHRYSVKECFWVAHSQSYTLFPGRETDIIQ